MEVVVLSQDLFQYPKVQEALYRITAYTFTGNKRILSEKLSIFINNTGIDELIITSPIFGVDAKLKSFSIVKKALEETV